MLFREKYVSFDKVTAIYKDSKTNFLHISDTDMQHALQYVSILSLMKYCQVGKKYFKYYKGIIPLLAGEDVARRMYLNIYWLHKGDKEKIDKAIQEFYDKLLETSQNQVKRLTLICKKDAFMNAFVNTQIATEFLSIDIEKSLNEFFNPTS